MPLPKINVVATKKSTKPHAQPPVLIDSVKPVNSKAKKTTKRRPSFDIARDFVEMNFAVLMQPELTPKEAKKARKQSKKTARQEAKKKHRLRNAFLYTLALLLVSGAAASVWWMTSLQPVNSNDTSARQFVVDKGASTDQVASALQKAGFIKNSLAYKIYSRLNHKIIEAGTHLLSPSYSMAEIANKLSIATVSEVNIQVPPGLSLKELRSTWKKYGYTDAEIDQAYAVNYTNSILNGRPEGATLEGYIYPETYRVYSNDKLEVVIKKALSQFENVAAASDWQAKFAAQGLTFYQGVTLASIVSEEVLGADDQKTVAGIFYNRLNDDTTLGSDVTYKYAYKQGLCAVDGPSCDSEYNTRIYKGLPPGPISNASFSSLNATADPTATDYYYFVAGDGDNNGKTFFARTLQEHEANTQLYCKTNCQ